MSLHAGTIITSTSDLDGSIFEKTVILITEKNEKGATGFVINKPFQKKLNELVEFNNSIPFPLYDGGPVEREGLFFIHSRPDLIEGGVQVNSSLYFNGNFKQAVKHINQKNITESEIKIFIGYCGWDAGELEAEIEEGSWEIEHAAMEMVFEK